MSVRALAPKGRGEELTSCKEALTSCETDLLKCGMRSDKSGERIQLQSEILLNFRLYIAKYDICNQKLPIFLLEIF